MKKEIYILMVFVFTGFSAMAADQVVTNTNDSGAGSLRQAIADVGVGDEITFSVTGTITLTSGQLSIDKSMTITGPGAGQLTISGNDASRVFDIGNTDNTITVTITGLTISNGYLYDDKGAGIRNYCDNLTLENCTISGNATSGNDGQGGGLANLDSSPAVTGCTFSGNTAQSGGGVANINGDGTTAAAPTFTNCIISNNESIDGGDGGGMYNFGDAATCNPTVTNCTISGNTGDWMGGGVCNYSSNSGGPDGICSPTFTNCIISGNIAQFGGGMSNNTLEGSTSSPTLINCTFSGNISNYPGFSYGGGMYNASYSTGAVANPSLTNCILWENGSDDVFNGGGATPTYAYCNLEDGVMSGTGNISSNPNFTTAVPTAPSTGGDLNLLPGSPCEDQGDNTANSTSFDADGNTRIQGGTIDMGALEKCIIWDGSENSSWNTAANWDGDAIPDNTYDVKIANTGTAPIIAGSQSADCIQLTVENSADLTINSGASLITTGSITNNGTINMQRAIEENGWHLISIPCAGITANTFLGDYLQYWSEPDEDWFEIIDPSTALNNKQGYSLWPTPDKAETTYTFTGTPLTSEQTIAMTSAGGGENDGMNLLGNPYPSSIDWDVLDETYGSVYYWDSQNQHYDIWSGSGSTNGGQQYLPPMQGFFVFTATAKDFTIDNTARTHANASSFYKGGQELNNGLRLEAANQAGQTDDMLLLFNDNSAQGFELQTDAWKMFSGTTGMPEVYVFGNNDKLAIESRPETDFVQLGFTANKADVYSIGVKEIADITNTMLEDTKTGTFHDLQKGAYEFAWEMGDDEMRFKLHVNAVGIEETPVSENNVLIYAANRQIFIRGAAEGKVLVSDLTGRIVLQQEIRGEETISVPVNLQTGVYLITVQNRNEIKTEKVFIKK